MELRTTFNIEPSGDRITYNDSVIFIGSCFASSMGLGMQKGRMPVMINPSGAVYNPVSVIQTIENIISDRDFAKDDLFKFNGKWISFSHHTEFSSEDPVLLLDKINRKNREAASFIKKAGFMFITFGTSRVFRFTGTGSVVSNCHKVPASMFRSELLGVDETVGLWTRLLERLRELYPGLKVIFTISPVRHWKDGAHGNQVSKSVLFLIVEELLKHPSNPQYFPAYELVMDDLRDYRFYAEDMLHPSSSAISYIREAFETCYFDRKTLDVRNEIENIVKATEHRFNTDSTANRESFAGQMIKKISEAAKKYPFVDLTPELEYFRGFLSL